MRRFSQKSGFSTLSELNVTPLLDLAFVLLIIFMITTPLMDNSIDLTVPSASAAQNAVDPNAVQTISLDREGVLKLNNAPIGFEQLRPALEALKQEKPALAVIVRSDKELAVQKLVDVMNTLQAAGITKVGVATQTSGGAK